jgi:hypothetical protein
MEGKTESGKMYEKVETQDLIIYAIYSVIKSKEVCTYERLVKECFQKFPKVFSFKKYPQWPDSLKFDRPLRTLRAKGLIVGSVRDHFELTRFGQVLAHETESLLLGKAKTTMAKRSGSIGRSVDDKIIQTLKQSDAFKRFHKNPESFKISETEFRSLLRCTLETPERVLKQNLEYYRNVAKSYNEKDVIQFLSACEGQLPGRG